MKSYVLPAAEATLRSARPLRVLVVTDADEVAHALEQASFRLGHTSKWKTYTDIEEILDAVESESWDIAVIEAAIAVERFVVPVFERAAIKLRLLLDSDRVGIIVAGAGNQAVSRDSEWLVHMLGRLLWHLA